VRKENLKVISFHEKMGAVKNGETEFEYLYEVTKQSILLARKKFEGNIL
jgi:hypothetical protein